MEPRPSGFRPSELLRLIDTSLAGGLASRPQREEVSRLARAPEALLLTWHQLGPQLARRGPLIFGDDLSQCPDFANLA